MRVSPARQVRNPQHETTRQVLTMLREGGGPLSYYDVDLALMQPAGANLSDRELWN